MKVNTETQYDIQLPAGTAVQFKGVELGMEEFHIAYLFDKLRKDFGFLESAKKQMPVNGDGEVMPMYTYPCYEYLNSIDWTGADVFEYGTGFSTVWWKNKGANIYGVEHNKQWYDKVDGKKLGNIILENDVERYPKIVWAFSVMFDVIVIDGLVRYECVEPAVSNLKPGGMIIFDNSDWHKNTKELLDTKDLILFIFMGSNPHMWIVRQLLSTCIKISIRKHKALFLWVGQNGHRTWQISPKITNQKWVKSCRADPKS